MVERRLDALIDQAMGGVECRRRRLRHVRELGAPDLALPGFVDLGEVDPVEEDRAGRDAATRPGIAHGGEADRRLAGPRLADEAEHLAATQRQVDAADDLVPALLALPLDAQAADLEQHLAAAGGA